MPSILQCILILLFQIFQPEYFERQRQRRSQEFDLGRYKWVKETKQPHKKFNGRLIWGVYIPIYPRRYAPGQRT